MGRTGTFENMKDEAIEEIKDELVEYRKQVRALTRARTKVGESKDRLSELMKKHGKKTYSDDETGYIINLNKTELLVVKAAKKEKDEADSNEVEV